MFSLSNNPLLSTVLLCTLVAVGIDEGQRNHLRQFVAFQGSVLILRG